MVCIEPFTKQAHRKQAACPYCDVKACVKCTQTYLLGTTDDAHCMGCRRVWTREVLDTILLTTWINDEYKKHRENILMDRERSRLPAAQLLVERKKSAKDRDPIIDAIAKELSEQQLVMDRLRTKYNRELNIKYMLLNGQDPFADGSNTGAAAQKEERRVFVMPCPASGCRGFLSQAYKCGICDVYVCPECRELKGTQRDAEHTCNPDTVATVQRMKKECRGCPECGTQIFKIEGCDQMFCTNCNTPFSWTSGKKITSGALHNPHYFEYLRKMNNGVQPRTPGDIPCFANLPGAWEFDREVFRKFGLHATQGANAGSALYAALNTILHIHHVEIPAQTNHAEDQDNTELNVRYLTNEITLERWKQLLQQKEKRRQKRDEIRMRYEALLGACVDLYGNLMRVARAPGTKKEAVVQEVGATQKQLAELVAVYNEGMLDVSKRYKCQVLTINTDTYRRVKSKAKVERKKKEKGAKKGGKKGGKKGATAVESDEDSTDIEELESEDDEPRQNIIVGMTD